MGLSFLYIFIFVVIATHCHFYRLVPICGSEICFVSFMIVSAELHFSNCTFGVLIVCISFRGYDGKAGKIVEKPKGFSRDPCFLSFIEGSICLIYLV